MEAEIITIGDEILIGQVVDTNSAWMGQQLNLAGIKVKQITSVTDDPAHIVKALDEARSRATVILITGGLGPTKDDITKKTLATYFGMGWRTDEAVLQHVTEIFARFGREITPINKLQAQVPDGCEVLHNDMGTAPGMWFDHNGCVFISMPGVPFEMKSIMTTGVLPRLRSRFKLPFIFHKTILTQGIGESALAEQIEPWEDSLAALNIKLAYLPSPGIVRLRMTSSGEEETVRKNITAKLAELQQQIPEYIFGYDDDVLPDVLGKLLLGKNATLAVAESCTGGLIASQVTGIAGSSAYFIGGVVAYSNQVKMQLLGVKSESLEKHGAVSEEVVRQMAEGIRRVMHTDYSIATTGIAGPGGGSEEKPVGTIWIAVSGPNGTITKKGQFGDKRHLNMQRAATSALNMLRKHVEGTLE